MKDREKYLKKLKKELDNYKKELLAIQKEFKGKTGKDIEKINQSLQNIFDEAVTTYGRLESASTAEWEPIKAITNDAFNNLRNSLHEKMEASAHQIKEYAGHIEENCQEQLENVAKYVRKNPLKSLLFAAGAGFILGKILK